MILRSLRAERFGVLNPGAAVDFGPDITVIHGQNGSGKSTLLRALTFCFYQRHGLSAPEALAQIVPRGRDLWPRVEVVFESAGVVWRVTKQFVKRADTEIARFERGGFVPLAQGPAAEDQLREILGSERKARGLAQASDRGIGEILLVDQGSLRLAEVSALARDRLRLVLDQVATTQGSHAILATVEKRYAETFGKSGELGSRTALAEAQAELARLAVAKAALEAEHGVAVGIEAELAALESECARDRSVDAECLKRDYDAAWAAKGEAGKLAEQIKGLAGRIGATNDEIERLAIAGAALCRAREERRRFVGDVETAERDARIASDAAARARVLASEAEADVGRGAVAEREIAARERAASDARRAREAADRIPDLDERLRRYEEDGRRIGEIDAAIAERRRPSDDDIVALRRRALALRECERDAARLDVRVRITAESAVTMEVGPARVDLGAQETREVVSPDAIELRIPGVARIEVDAPGGLERARAARDLEAARTAWHGAAAPFATESLETLELLAAERKRLERDRDQLVASRRGTFQDEGRARAAREDLAACRATLADLLDRHPQWGRVPPAAAVIQAEDVAVERERRQFLSGQKAREDLFADRRRAADESLAAATGAEERARALAAEVVARDAAIRLLEAGEPDDSAREAALRAARDRGIGLARELETARAALDALGDPDRTIERVASEMKILEASLRDAQERRARLTERLEGFRARGLWDALAAVDQDIARWRATEQREQLEVEALKLLRETLARQQAAAVESAIRPVADRVARMARFLFGQGARSQLTEGLVPQSLAVDGCEIPVGLLSAGTQDQLALLVRLALGELYAEKVGRHACVLDDPLVNCDRERRGRMLDILASSRALQIVILTCSPEQYRGLPADRTRFVAMEDVRAAFGGTAAIGASG